MRCLGFLSWVFFPPFSNISSLNLSPEFPAQVLGDVLLAALSRVMLNLSNSHRGAIWGVQKPSLGLVPLYSPLNPSA